jgi:hypothetical protein
MVRIYFTLDGKGLECTEGQFENDAKEELEIAIADGNEKARLLLETDGSEDFQATFARLEGGLAQ